MHVPYALSLEEKDEDVDEEKGEPREEEAKGKSYIREAVYRYQPMYRLDKSGETTHGAQWLIF